MEHQVHKKGFGAVTVLFIALPGILLSALQVFSPDTAHLATAAGLGLGLGLLAWSVLQKSLHPIFEQGSGLKILALAFPALLLLGLWVERFKSAAVWFAILLAFYVLAWLAFIRPVKNENQRLAISLISLAMLVVCLYAVITKPYFSPDSWSYYEMSKTILHGPFRVPTIRQYLIFTDQAISFPYLYPLLIALFNQCAGIGIYSGILVNLSAVFFTGVTLYRISQRLLKNPLPGAMAFVFLCSHYDYLGEITSARSIPVSILLTLLVFYWLCPLPQVRYRQIFWAGLAAGAGMVTRFDGMIVAFFAAICVAVLGTPGRWKSLGAFIGGLLPFTLPWMIYSLVFFNSLWISDNGGTLWLLSSTVPQRYYSQQYVVPTFWNMPGIWFKLLFTVKLPTIARALGISWVLGGGVAFLVWFGYLSAIGCLEGLRAWAGKNKRLLFTAAVVAVIYLAKTASLVLVGYNPSRYHIETCVFLVFFATALLTSLTENHITRQALCKHSLAIVATIILLYHGLALYYDRLPGLGENRKDYVLQQSTILGQDPLTEEIYTIVTQHKENPRVLFIDYEVAFRFGALTGIQTFTLPFTQNDDPQALLELSQTYIHPDYVLAAWALPEDYMAALGLEQVAQLEGLTLYQVTNPV